MLDNISLSHNIVFNTQFLCVQESIVYKKNSILRNYLCDNQKPLECNVLHGNKAIDNQWN